MINVVNEIQRGIWKYGTDYQPVLRWTYVGWHTFVLLLYMMQAPYEDHHHSVCPIVREQIIGWKDRFPLYVLRSRSLQHSWLEYQVLERLLYCDPNLLHKKRLTSDEQSGGPSPEARAGVKMAMDTRNPITRQILPDKKAGMESIFYPWVHYWTKFLTHRVRGYGYACILPIPVYARVKNTRRRKLN